MGIVLSTEIFNVTCFYARTTKDCKIKNKNRNLKSARVAELEITNEKDFIETAKSKQIRTVQAEVKIAVFLLVYIFLKIFNSKN